MHCGSLTHVTLSAALTSIGGRAFAGCTSLALTSLPDGLTSIGEFAFFHCGSLALTRLPDGLTSIGEWGFAHCTSLALTSLPSGLAIIGDHHVFYGCHLSLGADRTTSRTVSLTPLTDSISRLRLGRVARAVPTVTANRARRERKKALKKAPTTAPASRRSNT